MDTIDEELQILEMQGATPPTNLLTQVVNEVIQNIEKNNRTPLQMLQISYVVQYLANGWIDKNQANDYLKKILNGQTINPSNYFANSTPSGEWVNYVNSTTALPIQLVTTSAKQFSNSGLYACSNPLPILENYFPHLVSPYSDAPSAFEFRYVYVDKERVETYGDTESNLRKFGVDFDLSSRWMGIWSSKRTIWGGGIRSRTLSTHPTYLIIYYDPNGLMNIPGFYQEGALNFTKLVIAGKTLKDLMLDGGVLKISNTEES